MKVAQPIIPEGLTKEWQDYVSARLNYICRLGQKNGSVVSEDDQRHFVARLLGDEPVGLPEELLSTLQGDLVTLDELITGGVHSKAQSELPERPTIPKFA